MEPLFNMFVAWAKVVLLLSRTAHERVGAAGVRVGNGLWINQSSSADK